MPGNVLGIRESKIKRWGLYPKGASSLIGNTLRSQIPRLDQDWLPVFSKKITWAHIPYLPRRAEPSGIYQALSLILSETCLGDFPGGPVVKDLPSNAENVSLIPGQGTKIPTCHRATKPMRYKEELVCRTKGKKNRRNMLVNDAFLWVSPWGWYMKTRKSI